MKQKIIRYAVMIVALGVFIYSAYQLTLIYIESKESMEVYDEEYVYFGCFRSGDTDG